MNTPVAAVALATAAYFACVVPLREIRRARRRTSSVAEPLSHVRIVDREADQ